MFASTTARRHRGGRRHPLGECLHLRQGVTAAPGLEAAAEFADEVLGGPIMVREVEGREAGIQVIEHALDCRLRVDPSVRSRNLPHPVKHPADVQIGGELKPA